MESPPPTAPRPAGPSGAAVPGPDAAAGHGDGIQWENVLEFAHLFRGFRLAINPAKLAVALLAILLIYAAGRLFDLAWGPQVYADEMMHFVSDRRKRTGSCGRRT